MLGTFIIIEFRPSTLREMYTIDGTGNKGKIQDQFTR